MPAEAHRAPDVAPSQRKLRAIAKVQSLGAKLSDGTDYNLQHHIIAGVTLDQVRQDLAGIRGSLADRVIDERAP